MMFVVTLKKFLKKFNFSFFLFYTREAKTFEMFLPTCRLVNTETFQLHTYNVITYLHNQYFFDDIS